MTDHVNDDELGGEPLSLVSGLSEHRRSQNVSLGHAEGGRVG